MAVTPQAACAGHPADGPTGMTDRAESSFAAASSDLAAEIDTVRRALRLLRGERRAAIGVCALGVLGAGFEVAGLSLLVPLAAFLVEGGSPAELPGLGRLFALAPGGFEPTAITVVAVATGSMLAGMLVSWINGLLSNDLALRAGEGIRRRVFEMALLRPISEVESLPDGRLTNTLATESWRIGDTLFAVIGGTVTALTCLVFLAAMVALSPTLTLMLIGLSALTTVAIQLATRRVRELGRRAVATNEAFMAEIWDALGGLRLIHAFGAQDAARRRFHAASGEMTRVFHSLGVVNAGLGPLTQALTLLTIAALLGVALFWGTPPQVMVGFLALAYRLQPRVASLLRTRAGLRGLEASVATVEEAIARADAATEAARVAMAERTRRRQVAAPEGAVGRIAVERATVRWPGAPVPALTDVSCAFAGGEITALVGASGAGKSTLAAVLLGFLAPEAGRVLVDGVPLEEIDAIRWRRRVAFVDQAAHLFDASIADNIRFADTLADDAAVRAAAVAAGADAFIRELPDGYATSAARRKLSSGQKQRVALARAILRRPALLVLDEATNALDMPTERFVGAALKRLASEGCAVVVIAHRRESLATATQAVVLEAGRVAEVGRPADLIGAGGVFSRLYGDHPAQAEF